MKQKRARGVHTAIVLPQEILDQLRQSERGVSEEVRRRVALTIEQDATDPITRELCQLLVDTAVKLTQMFGVSWHSQPKAHAAFAAAMAEHLAAYTPERPPAAVASDLLGPDDPPETIGKMLATQVRFGRSYPHLEAAAKGRAAHLRTKHIQAKQEGGDNG